MEQPGIVTLLYYIEVNIVCISVLALLLYQFKSYASGKKTERIVLRNIMIACICFCLFDTVAICARGQTFPGAGFIVRLSNSLYLASSALMCSLWTEYAVIVTDKNRMKKNGFRWFIFAPSAAMVLLIIISSFTGWLFTVDEYNIYHRGPLISLHWIICLGDLFATTVLITVKILSEKTRSRRRSMMPMCIFSVAPFVCGVIQIFFYGTTLIQAGLTFSVLLVVLRIERAQISIDDLTGLNNRHEFNSYMERINLGEGDSPVYLMMLDINQFKQINDTFGHISGDEALVNAANILKRSCAGIQHRVFLSRYGGDEFVVVGLGGSDEAEQFRSSVSAESEAFNSTAEVPYSIRFSIGIVSGRLGDFSSEAELVRLADEKMYENKRAIKADETNEKEISHQNKK